MSPERIRWEEVCQCETKCMYEGLVSTSSPLSFDKTPPSLADDTPVEGIYEN